jgi:glycine/D-amino acid oxidase-like deaminating enzyme
VANVNTFAPASFTGLSTTNWPEVKPGDHVAVIGAGAFGVFSALWLLRVGVRVTLVDMWGPGNARSSSGDETRVIRSTYGANEFYFDLNVRALELWRSLEQDASQKLFYNPGVLWFCYHAQTPLVDLSIPFAKKHRMEYEYMTAQEVSKRYPLIHVGDLHHAYHDPFGGYLLARNSVRAGFERFVKEGGEFIQAEAQVGEIRNGRLTGIRLSGGESLRAEAYLFACGSWMGKVLPFVQGNIHCTRQEVFYFGTPASQAVALDNLPVWIDADGEAYYYGIPGNQGRGFKVGVDLRGPTFDPTTDDRVSNPAVLQAARNFLQRRFPSMADAPVIETRVCPYESSADGNFIFDLYPETSNAIVLGGGSGHGFKHSIAMGELVCDVLMKKRKAPALFSLPHFQG